MSAGDVPLTRTIGRTGMAGYIASTHGGYPSGNARPDISGRVSSSERAMYNAYPIAQGVKT
jgi:hypothetical protein